MGSEADEARLAAAVEAAYADGYRVFVSGMAIGFDLAAAEAVVHLRSSRPDTQLVAAVPFEGQAAGYSASDRSRYDVLMAAADETVVLATRYSHGCYFRRDEWMVERSGRLICYYDASLGGRGAGTRYTVKYALVQGLEIVNLYRDEATLF